MSNFKLKNKMIYETKITFTKIDKNGNEKTIRERFLVENATNFGDAEEQTYEFCQGLGIYDEIDVTDVKRSKVHEIVNTRATAEDNLFLAEVADIQHNDEGEEVELVYKLMLFALNLDDAYKKLKEHLSQGYTMIPISVKKTKFVSVIYYIRK